MLRMNDILIDTNVFIYDLDKSSQYNKTANKILNSDNSLFTSSKNISEFFAVLSKFDVSIDLILKYYEDINA